MNLKKIIRSSYRYIFWRCWSRRFAELGENSWFQKDIIWHKPEHIAIGKNVFIKERCRLEAILTREKERIIRLRIGDNTIFQQGCQVIAAESVSIGRNVLIAANVLITDHDHRYDHPEKPAALLRDLTTAPVVIEDGCWLGYGSVVLKGVTIGERAVIGSNSVVTGDIPPWSVAVGIPARVIKKIVTTHGPST